MGVTEGLILGLALGAGMWIVKEEFIRWYKKYCRKDKGI